VSAPVRLTDDRRERLARLLAACRDDPERFHRVILHRPPLHHKQRLIARSVVESRVVVVPGAHSVGKSWLASSLVLWWLYTRAPARVLTTSPSYSQLAGVLWAGIRAAYRASPVLPLLGGVHLSEGKGSLELRLAPDHYAAGYSTNRPENLQGFHNSLVITDESSGIADEIWDALHSFNNSKLVCFGNPIRAGHFKALYERALDPAGNPGYAAHRLTAWDSPHSGLTDEEIAARGLPAGLTSRTWIESVRREYGEGSLYWVTRVEARFPETDTESLLPAAWVDRCVAAEVLAAARPAGRKWLATDPSGGVGKDKSTYVIRDDNAVLEVWGSARHGVFPDALEQLTPVVAAAARRHGIAGPSIIFDANGLGRSLGTYLEAEGLPGAVPYFGGESGGRRFSNLRTACAFALKRRLDPGTPALPPFAIRAGERWPELRAELLALRTRLDTAELDLPKEALEPKEAMRAALGRSPDFADALLMSCTFPDW
jgi:hypothetical protein